MGDRKRNTSSVDSAIAFILVCGALTSSIIAIVVIAVPLILPLTGVVYKIPVEVKEWGGVIIGFYFGSFVTFAASIWKNEQIFRGGSSTLGDEKSTSLEEKDAVVHQGTS